MNFIDIDKINDLGLGSHYCGLFGSGYLHIETDSIEIDKGQPKYLSLSVTSDESSHIMLSFVPYLTINIIDGAIIRYTQVGRIMAWYAKTEDDKVEVFSRVYRGLLQAYNYKHGIVNKILNLFRNK